jgi:tetratricopeptide (TPR) repeat protein
MTIVAIIVPVALTLAPISISAANLHPSGSSTLPVLRAVPAQIPDELQQETSLRYYDVKAQMAEVQNLEWGYARACRTGSDSQDCKSTAATLEAKRSALTKLIQEFNLFIDTLVASAEYRAWQLYKQGLQRWQADHALRANHAPPESTVQFAVHAYTAAITLNPKLAEAYLERGRVRSYGTTTLREAVRDYSAAIELKPTLTDAYILRAMAALKLGDVDGAWADVETALRQDNHHAGAYRLRARLKAKAGDCAGAQKDFAKAEEAGAGFSESMLKCQVSQKEPVH